MLWLKHKFFYPVGNTPAVDLTSGLPYEEDATVLLLGCGDVRSTIYSFYAGLSASRDNFSMDITCCDIEPGILARNVLLLTLLVEGHPKEQLWNINYHFKVDNSTLDVIQAQCKKLATYAKSISDWNESPYCRWIRFSSTHTLREVERYWSLYQKPISKTQQIAFLESVSAMRAKKGMLHASRSRSAGQYALESVLSDDENFAHYWRTGVIDVSAAVVQKATRLNPTFFHSLNGTGAHFHYLTYPLAGFHLAEVFARSSSHISISIEQAKSQFGLWGQAFRAAVLRETSTVVLRLYAGDALACCRALSTPFADLPSTQIPVAAWYGGCALLDGGDYEDNAPFPAPKRFNIIDSTNLVDHITYLNIVIAASPLLSPSPISTLYTESFEARDKGYQALRDALLMDVDTATMLFGIAPVPYISGFSSLSHGAHFYLKQILRDKSSSDLPIHHERIAWKHVPPGHHIDGERESICRPLFLPQDLARILFDVYQEMMPAERPFDRPNASPLGTKKRALEDMRLIPRFHRESLVALLALVKQRELTNNWTQCMEWFFDLFRSQDRLMLSTNYHQELCGLLHRYGVYTVDQLQSRHCPVSRLNEEDGVFEGWRNVPKIICVTIVVPRSALKFIEQERRNGVGTPAFEMSMFKAGMAHNLFAAIRCAWGHVAVGGNGESKQLKLHEVPCGATSSEAPGLVVFAWVPSWTLVALGIPNTTVRLSLGSSPSVGRFMADLGPYLALWTAGLGDEAVHLTKEPPMSLDYIGSSSRPATLLRRVGKSQKYLHCPIAFAGPGVVDSVTARHELKDPREHKLLQGGAVVTTHQLSPWSVLISFGDVRSIVTLPVAVDESRLRTRIARKSGYIELVGVPCRGSMSPSPGAIKSYDSTMKTGRRFLQKRPRGPPYSWAFHQVNVERLPVLKYHSAPATSDIASESHLQLALSRRQRDLVNNLTDAQSLKSLGDQLMIKYSVSLMFDKIFASRPSRMFGLSSAAINGSKSPFCFIFPNAIRIDPTASSNIIECFVLPVEPRNPAVYEVLRRLGQSLFMMEIGHADAFRSLIPSFVERCRNWEHKANCEYRRADSDSDGFIICSCGTGVGASEARCFGLDNPLRALAPFVTRAAISQLFMPSYIEPLGDISDLSKARRGASPDSESTETPHPASESGQDKCTRCTKTLGENLRCGRCKQVSYCGSGCQKTDWAKHKKVCRVLQ